MPINEELRHMSAYLHGYSVLKEDGSVENTATLWAWAHDLPTLHQNVLLSLAYRIDEATALGVPPKDLTYAQLAADCKATEEDVWGALGELVRREILSQNDKDRVPADEDNPGGWSYLYGLEIDDAPESADLTIWVTP